MPGTAPPLIAVGSIFPATMAEAMASFPSSVTTVLMNGTLTPIASYSFAARSSFAA
jgi:hypothetical protein